MKFGFVINTTSAPHTRQRTPRQRTPRPTLEGYIHHNTAARPHRGCLSSERVLHRTVTLEGWRRRTTKVDELVFHTNKVRDNVEVASE